MDKKQSPHTAECTNTNDRSARELCICPVFHTPTPWKVYSVFVNNAPNETHIGTGKWGALSVAVVGTQEDAELIVRAVNAHELLLTALKCLVNGYEPYSGCNLERARQAIAKAEQHTGGND